MRSDSRSNSTTEARTVNSNLNSQPNSHESHQTHDRDAIHDIRGVVSHNNSSSESLCDRSSVSPQRTMMTVKESKCNQSPDVTISTTSSSSQELSLPIYPSPTVIQKKHLDTRQTLTQFHPPFPRPISSSTSSTSSSLYDVSSLSTKPSKTAERSKENLHQMSDSSFPFSHLLSCSIAPVQNEKASPSAVTRRTLSCEQYNHKAATSTGVSSKSNTTNFVGTQERLQNTAIFHNRSHEHIDRGFKNIHNASCDEHLLVCDDNDYQSRRYQENDSNNYINNNWQISLLPLQERIVEQNNRGVDAYSQHQYEAAQAFFNTAHQCWDKLLDKMNTILHQTYISEETNSCNDNSDDDDDDTYVRNLLSNTRSLSWSSASALSDQAVADNQDRNRNNTHDAGAKEPSSPSNLEVQILEEEYNSQQKQSQQIQERQKVENSKVQNRPKRTHSLKPKNNNAMNNYMFQRMEFFDEGIHTFSHVERLYLPDDSGYYVGNHANDENTNDLIDNEGGYDHDMEGKYRNSVSFNEHNNSYSELTKVTTAGGVEAQRRSQPVTPSPSEHELNTLSPSIIGATLWFNQSQVHKQYHEWTRAVLCLEMAWCEIQNSVTISTNHKSSGLNDTICRGKGDKDETELPSSCSMIAVCILVNLGQLQYRSGNLEMAIATYSKAYPIIKATPQLMNNPVAGCILNSLGVLHYHLLSSKPSSSSSTSQNDPNEEDNAQNAMTSNKRMFKEAMDYFQEALLTQTKLFGKDHDVVGTTFNNIGRLYVLNDDFESALESYEVALNIRGKKCNGGDDDDSLSLDYAATAFNAGQSYHQRGQLDRALHLYEQFLKVFKNFTKSHRDVAVVLSGIAQIHQQRKDYKKASALYRESLEAGRSALGEYHSEVAMILNKIGNFHFELEEYDEALEAYQEGLKIEKQILGEEHRNVVVTLCNLGEIYRLQKEWDKALSIYKKVIKIQKKQHNGDDAVDVASTLYVLGRIYDRKGNNSHASYYFQSALIMRRNVLGEDHLDVASTLISLGTIFYRSNKFQTALELFNESLRIRCLLLGRNNREVSFTLYNIGLIHQKQGSHESAAHAFHETLSVETEVIGASHGDVAMTFCKLGEVYNAQNTLKKSLQYFNEAAKIQRAVISNATSAGTVSKNHKTALARTLNEIGNIHLVQRNTVLMMEAFSESARLYKSMQLTVRNVTVQSHLYALDESFTTGAAAA